MIKQLNKEVVELGCASTNTQGGDGILLEGSPEKARPKAVFYGPD